jgi:hypothetical protein
MSDAEELPSSKGDKSSSEERYRSCKEMASLLSGFGVGPSAVVSIRRVSLSGCDKFGDDAELLVPSGTVLSNDHCWSCAATETSTMTAVALQRGELEARRESGTLRWPEKRQREGYEVCE